MKSLIVAFLLALAPASQPSQSPIQLVQWCGVGCQSYCANWGWTWRGRICRQRACQCRRNNGRWF